MASTAAAPATSTAQETQQYPQQYLAIFALFSFFNSPLTSSNSHHTTQNHGHVLSLLPVPLVYAPEIVSQFNPPAGLPVATVTWRDWVQIAHLAITVLLFISVLARVGSGLGLTQLGKLFKGGSTNTDKENARKKVEMIILGRDAVPSFTSALTLYRSLPAFTSPITCALYLYTVGSCSSTPALARPVLRARARAIWSSSPRVEKKDQVILSSAIEDAYVALPSVMLIEGLNIVHAIAECLVTRKLGDVLGNWFIREVNSSNSKGKAVVEKPSEDLTSLVEVAKHLGGEVAVLGRNVERIKELHSETASATNTVPVVWKAVVPGGSVSEGEDSDDSDISSLSASIDSLDDYVTEDDEEESQMPSTILHALVLYRSLFSSTPTTPGIGPGLLAPPPTVSVEPPTPTTPTPVCRRTAALTSTTPSVTSSPVIAATANTSLSSVEQQKKMYALRKLLGSRVFEKHREVMEDARDRVVYMLVDAERQSLRVRL